MPSLLECLLIIEERCKAKGNVITIPKDKLLALKHYGVLLKNLCEIAQDYLGTTLECLDEFEKEDILLIAEENWND